ncbi:MAG: hypothetical protein IPK32_04425 [Verrucomicrobiaceae bacterium]|nr:hypothetical protein [Verrucomicrobiaceae bacterium]
MEPKAWLPLVLLAFLVGGIFGYRHLELVDKANSDLLQSRASAQAMEENLRIRKNQWEGISASMTAADTKLAEAQTRESKVKALTEEANTKQRKAESDIKYLADSLPGQVEKVRTLDLNSVLAAVTLNDGKRLTNAQIKKIEDNGITFIHSDGSGIILVDNLPADLVEKYDLSVTGLVKTAQGLKLAVDEATAPPSTNKKSPSRASPTVSKSPEPARDPSVASKMSADQQNLKSVQLRLADMEAKINAVARIADQWATNANAAEGRVANSRSRGAAPSGSAMTEAKNARAQYSAAHAQFTALEAEYRKLKVEEAHLKALLNKR